MPILAKKFQTQLDQHIWLAHEIEVILKSKKVDPAEIAIIARKHSQLTSLVPVFEQFEIPIFYERGQNILEKKEIVELITILRFVDSLNRSDTQPQEDLLPEILCYEFWRFDPKTIYELSQYAYTERCSWLHAMLELGNTDLKVVAEFFIHLGTLCKSSYLEQVIDEVTGVSNQVFVADSTEEEVVENVSDDDQFGFSHQDIKYDPSLGAVNKLLNSQGVKFVSSYKWYYFDQEYNSKINIKKTKNGYLAFLSALKVFIESIRDFQSSSFGTNSSILKVTDLLKYIDLLQKRGLRLVDNSAYNSPVEAVSLLTAHKAKGLEFEYVFIVDCTEETWNGRSISNKVGLPSNLSLLPQADNQDDFLRLFFVVLTRAKRHLTLLNYKYGKNMQEIQSLGCLANLVEFEEVEPLNHDTDVNIPPNSPQSALPLGTPTPLKGEVETEDNKGVSPLVVWFESTLREANPEYDLKQYLKARLENYKLSVTHLNNFLDLVRGGPQFFLEKNILAFPQAKSTLAGYGSAMHSAINEFYKEYKRQNALPKLAYLEKKFETALADQRLNPSDESALLKKGLDNLGLYYQDQSHTFNITDQIEEDFKNQGVHLGEAKITGKIDKMDVDKTKKLIQVVDFKTGKAHSKWTDSTLETAVKLQNYRRQLVFYKLLVENSRDFSDFKVAQGRLEFLDLPFGETRVVRLETEIDENEGAELAKLIQVVYKKITDLCKGEPLPDVSKYSKDLSGIAEFINDLLVENT